MIKKLQIRGSSMFLNMDRALRELTGIEDEVEIKVYGDEIRITAVKKEIEEK